MLKSKAEVKSNYFLVSANIGDVFLALNAAFCVSEKVLFMIVIKN